MRGWDPGLHCSSACLHPTAPTCSQRRREAALAVCPHGAYGEHTTGRTTTARRAREHCQLCPDRSWVTNTVCTQGLGRSPCPCCGLHCGEVEAQRGPSILPLRNLLLQKGAGGCEARRGEGTRCLCTATRARSGTGAAAGG